MKKLFAIIALGLLMTNCGGDSGGDDPDPTPDGGSITFTLGAKRLADAQELDNQLTWKGGDELGIYCSRISVTANYKAALSSASSFTSTFAFSDTQEHTFYLYAPYNTSGALSNKTPLFTVELPTRQQALSAVADHAVVYSRITTAPAAGNTVDVAFSHLFAYAAFDITSDKSSYRLKSVRLTAPEGVLLGGTCSVDLQSSRPATFAADGSNSITASAEASALVMSSARTAYMVLNPQTVARDYTVTVDLENPADGSVERFVGTLTGKTFPAQALTENAFATASMTLREDIEIDFGQTSALTWGGLASIEHANVSVVRNDIRTTPEAYGIRYRKSGSGDEWTTVTAVDGKSSTPSLVDDQTYEYEVWVRFEGKTSYSGRIEHFTAGVETRNFYKRSLVLKYTGIWCHNCPNMSAILETADTSWPNRMEIMEIHADQNTGLDPYELPGFNTIAGRYNVTAFPTSIVDARGAVSNGQVAVIAPVVVNLAKESLANFAPACGITFSSSLSDRALTVKTKIYVKESDEYLLTVALAEDRTTTQQEGYSGTFQMHNVSRVFMTDILGDTITVNAGTVYEKTFTCTLPADGVPANSKVVVYVQRKYNAAHPEKKGVTGVTYGSFGGYYVDNCRVATIGTKTLLEYEKE